MTVKSCYTKDIDIVIKFRSLSFPSVCRVWSTGVEDRNEKKQWINHFFPNYALLVWDDYGQDFFSHYLFVINAIGSENITHLLTRT